MIEKIKQQATDKYNATFKKKETPNKEPYNEMNDEEPPADSSTPKKKKDNTLIELRQNLSAAGDYLSNKVSGATATVKEQLSKLDNSVKESILKQKQSMNKWIANKADQKILTTLRGVEPKIILSTDKSIPCKCMKTFVNDVVISIWRDMTDLIRFELRVNLQPPNLELSKRPDNHNWLKPWYKLRNWILYNLYPYDMNMAQSLKRPSFIFLKLMQAIPYYGVQSFTFFMIFLAIDKNEEYQIVNFILDFKNLQFLTSGCLDAIIGFMLYFYCATLVPAMEIVDHQKPNNYCFMHGPGSDSHLIISIVSYFAQIILIWIAFAQLHRTKSRADFINDTLKREDQQKRGGRLQGFMIYDLISFTFTCSLTALIYYMYFYIPDDPWRLFDDSGSVIYFAKTFYGLLSLPFVIFIVPFFVRMFTSAVPTGYDEFGNVVPMISNIKITYQELPIDDSNQIDIAEVLNE